MVICVPAPAVLRPALSSHTHGGGAVMLEGAGICLLTGIRVMSETNQFVTKTALGAWEYQDETFEVKHTDVDYKLQGKSVNEIL